MFRIFGKTGYIFTDKKNPRWGVMSAILGMLADASIFLSLYLTYLNKGTAPMQYGVVVILAILYAVAGLVLGIWSLTEEDVFKFFPILGIVFNWLAFIAGGIILYFGIS